MEAASLEGGVKRLIADQMAVRIDQLKPDTRLLHDLGVDGADGWEVMEDFGKRFGVDLNEFEPRLHFGPDSGCNPVTALVILLFRPRWARFVPITVGGMVQAARTGKWITPNREAE